MSLPQGFDEALKSKNEILKNLAETISKIEQIAGADSVAEKFVKLHANLNSTADGIKEADVSTIKSSFDDYLNEINTFIEKQGDNLEPAVLCCLKDSQIVLKTYKEDIKPGNKLDDIYSDISWSKNLLNTQKYRPSIEVPVELQGTAEDHNINSIKQGLDDYKKSVEYVKEYRMGYLSHVSFGSKTPIETISYRSFLLDSAINAVNNGGPFVPLSPFMEDNFSSMHSGFTLDNPNKIYITGLYNSINFQKMGYDTGFNDLVDRIDNLVKYKNVIPGKEEEVNGIVAQFSTLKQKRKHLGLFDKNDTDEIHIKERILDKQLFTVNAIDIMLRHFKNNNPYRRLEDENEPIYGIYKAAMDFNKAVTDYLGGKPGAEAPTEEMFKTLISEIRNYATNIDNYVSVERNQLVTNFDIFACAGILSVIGEKQSGLKEDVDLALQEIKEKCSRTFVEDILSISIQYKDKVTEQIGGTFASALLEKEVAFSSSGLVTQKEIDLGKIIMLLSDDDYRQRLIYNSADAIKHQYADPDGILYKRELKNLLLASVIKIQYEQFVKGDFNADHLISNPYSGKVLNIFNNRRNPDIRRFAEEYYDSFLKNPAIKELFGKSQGEVINLLNSDGFEEYLNSQMRKDSLDLMQDVDKESMEVFTQADRSFGINETLAHGFENSAEFKAIQNSLKRINGKIMDPDNVKAEDYMELFNSCKDYVNTRSSCAKTEVGKQRFKAASTIMQDIGLKLMERLPEQKEEIEKEMKLTTLRSSAFRDRLEEKVTDKNLKSFVKFAKEKLGNKDIDSKIKSVGDADKLLDKYISVDRNRMNKEKIQPALNSAFDKLANDINIPDNKKRIAAMTDSMANIIYLNSLSAKRNSFNQKDFDRYLGKDFCKNGLDVIKTITKDYIANVPAERFKSMASGEYFKEELINGFNRFNANRERNRNMQKKEPAAKKSAGAEMQMH